MNLWTLLLLLLSAVSAENTSTLAIGIGMISAVILGTLAFNGLSKCSIPVLEGNVVLTDEALMINDFQNGTTITLECALGHLVDHGSNSIICTDGQWSKQELTCKKKDCGYPSLSPHMHYEIKDGTLFGASIRPVCDKGYYLEGSSYRKCLAYSWSGHSKCFVVTCKEPTVNPHAIIAVPLTKEHPEYKDVIEYSCEENYTLIGNSSISCQEDGEYSSPPPLCIDVSLTDINLSTCTMATPTDLQERESSSSSPRTLAIVIGMISAVILGYVFRLAGRYTKFTLDALIRLSVQLDQIPTFLSKIQSRSCQLDTPTSKRSGLSAYIEI